VLTPLATADNRVKKYWENRGYSGVPGATDDKLQVTPTDAIKNLGKRGIAPDYGGKVWKDINVHRARYVLGLDTEKLDAKTQAAVNAFAREINASMCKCAADRVTKQLEYCPFDQWALETMLDWKWSKTGKAGKPYDPPDAYPMRYVRLLFNSEDDFAEWKGTIFPEDTAEAEALGKKKAEMVQAMIIGAAGMPYDESAIDTKQDVMTLMTACRRGEKLNAGGA